MVTGSAMSTPFLEEVRDDLVDRLQPGRNERFSIAAMSF